MASQFVPRGDDAALAREAVRAINTHLAAHPDTEAEPVRMTVVGDPAEIVVPAAVLGLLSEILANLANGEGVTVVPTHAELTTQQAAELLNVSRPYFVGLLDAGEIEYRMVGTHRRVNAGSLMTYKDKDRRKRAQAADELSAMTRELGLT